MPFKFNPVTGTLDLVNTTSGGGGSGDVTGPASSTDNAITRFDGTTGKVIQNSGATLDDSGNGTFNTIVVTDEATTRANIGAMAKAFVTVGLADADYIVDMTADDVQIQAAVNAVNTAGGGIVWLKVLGPLAADKYRLAATVTIPEGVIIVGEKFTKGGELGVTIKTAASVTLTDMFTITGPSNPSVTTDLHQDSGFYNLTLDGNSTTTNLVKLTNADWCKFYNCRLISATNSIVTVWDSASDPVSATYPGGLWVINCIVSANSGVGIDLQYQTQCWILDSWFSGTSVSKWINIKCSNKIKILGNEFNTATNAVVLQDSATLFTDNVLINDNVFEVGSGNRAWKEERTHASSNKVSAVGNTMGSGVVTDTLVGSNNVVADTGQALLPATVQGSGNARFATYARVGSTSAPTNTTTGDLTARQIFVGGNQTEASISANGQIAVNATSFQPLQLQRTSGDANAQGFRFVKARGTISAYRRVQASDQVARFMAHGYHAADDVTDATLASASANEDILTVNATEAWTTSARGRSLQVKSIPTGSTTAVQRIDIDGTGHLVINESGAATDFRVESDTQANMLYVDGTNNRVGIANAAPAVALDVTGEVRSSTAGSNAASVVTVGGTQTLTNKTLTTPSMSGATLTGTTTTTDLQVTETAYFDAEVDNGNSGTADTIDWTVGNKQKSTLTGNVTYTFTAPPGPCNVLLKLVQDATGSRTATWPVAVKWAGGAAPTLSTAASAIDIVTFYYDGTNYFGAANLAFA